MALGRTETVLTLEGIHYVVTYNYGTDFTDAPEEKEYAWIEVVDCIAERGEQPVLVIDEHMAPIMEHCRKEASTFLALE